MKNIIKVYFFISDLTLSKPVFLGRKFSLDYAPPAPEAAQF